MSNMAKDFSPLGGPASEALPILSTRMTATNTEIRAQEAIQTLDLREVLEPLLQRWILIVATPFVAAVIALAASFLIRPTFTSTASFLPPQQQQSAAGAALASLGALSGLGSGPSTRGSGDQLIGLLQSRTLADRMVDQFSLLTAYDVKFRFEAREKLKNNVRFSMGKKDGIISVSVDDYEPARAAAMANAFVAELRKFSSELALTEAQQRRQFFEKQLSITSERLAAAQQSLQRSGFNAGALRAEPRAAADQYARVRAELTAAEVRLQTLRLSLSDRSPEIQQQLAHLSALRTQLRALEVSGSPGTESDYVTRYREYKYQETLFDTFSRQYELARLDESREGALIQSVDIAQVPEWKSAPRRGIIAIAAAGIAAFAVILGILAHAAWTRAAKARRSASDPISAASA